MKRIFPAVKLLTQTSPIDKREIGDAAIPGERRIRTSPSPSKLGPLTNERSVSSDVTLWRRTFRSGKIASVSSYSFVKAYALSSSIMTLWFNVCEGKMLWFLVHYRVVSALPFPLWNVLSCGWIVWRRISISLCSHQNMGWNYNFSRGWNGGWW